MTSLEVGLIVAGFSVTLASVFAMFVRISNRMRDFETLVTQLDTKVSPLWARVQTVIAQDLHHPLKQFAEMDKLLEELESLIISEEGRNRLKVLLIERSVDMDPIITNSQRESAKLMIHVMDKVVQESRGDEPSTIEQVSIQEPKKE